MLRDVKLNKKKLDLRGEVCPFTFVQTKLKLEEMKSGEILEVLLDHEAAIKDVPRSVEVEGHKVLSIKEEKEGVWKVAIRRK